MISSPVVFVSITFRPAFRAIVVAFNGGNRRLSTSLRNWSAVFSAASTFLFAVSSAFSAASRDFLDLFADHHDQIANMRERAVSATVIQASIVIGSDPVSTGANEGD